MDVWIETEKGSMKVEFYTDDAPGTVAIFIKLAKSGFYDGLNFHRVIPDFVIQGGCPNYTSTGGNGYAIPCELTGNYQYHDCGVLFIARAGRNTEDFQFFNCHNRENIKHFDRKHTCFGKVIENVEVIDDIRPGDKIIHITFAED